MKSSFMKIFLLQKTAGNNLYVKKRKKKNGIKLAY